MRMNNRIGIVTAGASGMGRAGAKLFAREGAKVAVVDINGEKAAEVAADIKKAGGDAISIAGDLTDEAFARSIVHTTVAQFGGLDFLWAHAGSPGPGRIEGMDLTQFDLALNLNVRSALATTIEAVPEIIKRGGGSVLYTSSTSGLRGSPVAAVYSVVKFGLVGMARSLAKRYGKNGVRFNCVCPGMIDTPMLPDFIRRPDEPKIADEELKRIIVERSAPIAVGRPGTPDDVAPAALFLLAHESAYITGVALPVDGGILA